MPDNEVLFHRYFSTLTEPDKNRYKGRLDLDAFEPNELRTAFEQIRAEINSRFVENSQRIMGPSGAVSVYMDYIDSDVINALAFHFQGVYFVGITRRMLRQFVEICSALWRLEPLADLLGIELNQGQRDFLFQTLLLLQIQFIADHELGHMFHGHCETLAIGNFYEEFGAELSTISSNSESLRDQAYEVEADGYAVEMMLTNLMNGTSGEFIFQRLKPSLPKGEFLLLLYVLAVGALLYWMPASDFEPGKVRTYKHPRGIIRMNVVMRDILRWCSEHRADLLQVISLKSFQWVLACVQVAANNAQQQSAWLAQGAFLRTAEGEAYMNDLYTTREGIRREMRPHRWQLKEI